MDLSFEPVELTLHEPFTIARGTQLVAGTVHTALTTGGITGIGEAAPAEHYGEFQGTVLAYLELLRTNLADAGETLPITVLHHIMEETANLNPAAKAAVDIAAYDLLGKRPGAPIDGLLGLDPDAAPRTSFTIGIDTHKVM